MLKLILSFFTWLRRKRVLFLTFWWFEKSRSEIIGVWFARGIARMFVVSLTGRCPILNWWGHCIHVGRHYRFVISHHLSCEFAFWKDYDRVRRIRFRSILIGSMSISSGWVVHWSVLLSPCSVLNHFFKFNEKIRFGPTHFSKLIIFVDMDQVCLLRPFSPLHRLRHHIFSLFSPTVLFLEFWFCFWRWTRQTFTCGVLRCWSVGRERTRNAQNIFLPPHQFHPTPFTSLLSTIWSSWRKSFIYIDQDT